MMAAMVARSVATEEGVLPVARRGLRGDPIKAQGLLGGKGYGWVSHLSDVGVSRCSDC